MVKRKVQLSKNIVQNVNPQDIYELSGELGDGSFGKVYKAKVKKTGEWAAAKIVKLEGDDELEDFQIEIDILAECDHHNVVKLFNAYIYKETIWLLLEFCDGGGMDDVYAELESPLSELQIRCVMRQMLEALRYVHEQKVVHRDIKAGNILLTGSGVVKLADFGVSAKNKSTLQRRDTFIGTPYWMAPEVIRCETLVDQPYDSKCDIWSLGITAIELAEMNPPLHEMHPMRVLFKIPKSPPPVLSCPALWSESFHNFLQCCLVKDPKLRPSAKELLDHPFVNGIDIHEPLKDLFFQFRAPCVEEIEDMEQENDDNFDNDTLEFDRNESPAPTAESHGTLDSDGDTIEASPDASPAPQRAAVLESDSSERSDLAPSTSIPLSGNIMDSVEREEDKKYTTIVKTRTFQKDGKTYTTKTRKLVEKNAPAKELDFANLRSLRNQQLRELRILGKSHQKKMAVLEGKLKAEWDHVQRTQNRELDLLEKKRLLDVDNLGKLHRKAMDKLQAEQSSKLKSFNKSQKKIEEKEWKAFKSEQKKRGKRKVKQLKEEMGKGSPRQERKRKEADFKGELAREFETEDFDFQAAQTIKFSDQLKEVKESQLVKLKTLEVSQFNSMNTVIKDQNTTSEEVARRQLSEKQTMDAQHFKARSEMLVQHQQERHEKEELQQRQFAKKREMEIMKKQALERKQMPKTQRSVAKKNEKEYQRKKASLLEAKKTEHKRARAAIVDTDRRKPLKKKHQEVERMFEKSLDEEFHRLETMRIQREIEAFNLKLDTELSEALTKDQADLEELLEIQKSKAQLLKEGTSRRKQELHARHEEESKHLQEKLEEMESQMLKVFAADTAALEDKYRQLFVFLESEFRRPRRGTE
eukprot:Nk52_evm92s1737 gene=Nk52_evmTU92s1737